MTDPGAPGPVTAAAADGPGPDLEAGRHGIEQGNISQDRGAQVPSDFLVKDGSRIVGAVIACAGGFAAHGRGGKIGVFDTVGLALAAIRAAGRRRAK
jgi:hypothetical protein